MRFQFILVTFQEIKAWTSVFETEPGIRQFQMIRRPLLLLLMFALISTSKVNAQSQDPYVVLNTSKGTIVMRIYTGMAPRTANNFLDLVSRGFYNGLSFHRVENWVIQGGDPNGNGSGLFVDPETGQVRYLALEASPYLHHNAPGVVAMAHSRSPNSGSCQFYITKKASPALDGSYSIFGGVVRGMDVVYNIQIGDRILSAEIVNRSANRSGQPQGSASAPRQPPPTGESGF